MVSGQERFTIGPTLGEGGMGVVYRARDNLHGHDVALKLMRGSGARDLYRFKREFRTLADLNHPNLCALHELHTTADQWFFTMELIDGVSILDWVRPLIEREPRLVRGPLHHDRLAAALAQLVDGVLALHRAGKLHRDLKPSNVMVTPAGRVVLLDFGLVATASSDDRTHEAAAVGTPSYMSPEQAADRPLTEASDWYAVGIMLYEALTGRKPYDGSVAQVLRRKQVDPPPPPGAIDPGVPPALEALCLDLLAIDPAERAGGAAILRALGVTPAAPPGDVAHASPSSVFVGRTAELATMTQAWDTARAGEVAVVVVRGESGMGKSALVREFLRRVDGDALVLAGRCYDRESMPFKALDPIIDALATALLGLPAATVAAALPREIPALARLFPVLRRVPTVADRVVAALLPSDPVELRSRAFTGLRHLLGALARARPVVISIDDLQWGDEDSAAVLVELIHNPEPLPLLLLLVHRNDDGGVVDRIIAPAASFATGASRLVALGPLADGDARVLVTRLGAGDDTSETAIRDAHGHPMFLTELVRSPRGHARATTIDDVIRRRIAALPATAVAILRVSAVATRPVPISLALRAAEVAAHAGDLPRLRAERLVRVHHRATEAEARIEPYHDRVRRALLADLGDDGQRAIHAALARTLERDGASDRDGLIAHWLGAGEPARAAAYAVAAAAVASEQLAFHRAAQLYQLALEHGRADAAETRAIRLRHAASLVNSGQLLAAAAEFATAAEGADPDQRLLLDQRRLEQLLRGGAVTEGLVLARDVMARVGHTLPLDDRRAVRAILVERLRIGVRGLRFKPRPLAELAPGVIQHLDTLRSVATSIMLGNPIHGRLVQFQFLRAALDAGEPWRVGVALTYEIGYVSQGGARSLARQDKILAQLRALVDQLGDPMLAGMTDLVAGIARNLSGRFREARGLLEQGMATLHDRASESRWELDVGTSFLLGVLFHLGETRLLARQVPLRLREATERGDVFAQRALRGWRGNIAWLIAGRPTAARTHVLAAAAASTDEALTVQRYYELISMVQIDLYEGELDAAEQRLGEAGPRIAASHLLRIQSIRIELAFLRGRLVLARAALSADRATGLGALRGEVRKLRREKVAWASAYALQLIATASHLRGDRDAALRELAACAEAYAACDLRLLATVAGWRIGSVEGGAAGAARIARTTAEMTAGAIADPAAMARMLWPWPDDDHPAR